MAITDELREWMGAASHNTIGMELIMGSYNKLLAIADRIDAEAEDNERFRREAGPFCDRLREAAAERADVTLFGVDYVAIPLDADGEPIHVGDVMDTEHFGTVEVEGFVHSAVAFYNYSGQPAYICTAPANTCHHHAPTVEDVLREFADEVWNRCCEGATASDSGIDELVAECAAKLQLREENS